MHPGKPRTRSPRLARAAENDVPRWPGLVYLGVLGGRERRVSYVGYRAFVGPVVASSRNGTGGQLLLNVAAGALPVALVAGARDSHVLRLKGERLRFGSLEFGIRMQ